MYNLVVCVLKCLNLHKQIFLRHKESHILNFNLLFSNNLKKTLHNNIRYTLYININILTQI